LRHGKIYLTDVCCVGLIYNHYIWFDNFLFNRRNDYGGCDVGDDDDDDDDDDDNNSNTITFYT